MRIKNFLRGRHMLQNHFYLYPVNLNTKSMSSEETNPVMNIESLQLKVENQQQMIKQLSGENEELYHQFNHLMIRNSKLLKRIDDLQGIIDDLHIRIEELLLINGNMLKVNDRIRSLNDSSNTEGDGLLKSNDTESNQNDLKGKAEFDQVFYQWKNYPGQAAVNEPNLRKQAWMLIHLYHLKSSRAADLFRKTGVGGVTGARYVATLKKYGLIRYSGARKKGQYEMTQKGNEFIEACFITPLPADSFSPRLAKFPVMEQEGIPVKEEIKEMLSASFNNADL